MNQYPLQEKNADSLLRLSTVFSSDSNQSALKLEHRSAFAQTWTESVRIIDSALSLIQF